MDVLGLIFEVVKISRSFQPTLMVNEHSNEKSTFFCRYLPGKIVMFHGHVSLPKGNPTSNHAFKLPGTSSMPLKIPELSS